MLKNYYFYLLILLLSNSELSAQTPCIDNLASVSLTEEYACDNYDLISRIPVATLAMTESGAEVNDSWGWTDSLNDNEYAIIATTNSTAFVNISDPVNPVFLGRINTTTNSSSWRDVKVYNDYVFIVADGVGAHGMQVFDLKLLRNGPEADETFEPNITYSGVDSCHNIVINESEAIAYLVGCNTFSGGPEFIDISDPLNPVSIGGFSGQGYTHDAQVITYNGPDTRYTNHDILIASNGTLSGTDRVVVLDVTDKNNAVELSNITYSQAGYTHQGWFTEDHRYFIFGDETDELGLGFNTKTIVLDLTDLTAPEIETIYYGPTSAIDHNGYVKGDEFFLANYRAGMRVLDIPTLISTNNSNAEIGYFDTYLNSDAASFTGAWSVYPYFESGNIIISDTKYGMFVVRKSGSLSIEENTLNNQFSISPNPATQNSLIKAPLNNKINKIEVFNILGQEVFFKDNIDLQEFVLLTEGYAKGIYLIKLNASITKKLIIK